MTGLPKVSININNDGLGQSPQTEDGIAGMILTGVTATGTNPVTVNVPKALFSLQDAENIGITETGTNAFAWEQIKKFYDIAGSGAELWIMLVLNTVAYSKYVNTNDTNIAQNLLNAANGRIRHLGVSKKEPTGAVVVQANGLDTEIAQLVIDAQVLAKTYFDIYKPFRVVIDGKDFNGDVSSLKDYTQGSDNRIAIVIANDNASKNADIGYVLGKLAYNPVQRSIGRVVDGALPILNAYTTNGIAVQASENSWDAIHNKGYIFLRSFVGRSGYFFTDDPTLTQATDDLNTLKRVAVIDKVRLLAYNVFVNKIHEEIPLETNGKISPAIIKSWSADVEDAIDTVMVANGELSGIKAIIDPAQDILATNEVKITLQALPVGYAKYISVDLGFTTSLEE